MQKLRRVGKHIHHCVFSVQVEPHDQHNVNKSQSKHPWLIPKRVNIHNCKVYILTEPPEIIIRSLVTVLELYLLEVLKNELKSPEIHIVQVNVPMHGQAVHPAVQGGCVYLVF